MGEAVFSILFFISLGLLIWGISIYRNTVVETKYLIATVILGIFIGEITFSFLIKRGPWSVWIFLIKALPSSIICCFLLLLINQELVNNELEKGQFFITAKGTFSRSKRGSCRQPFVHIDFYGVNKQLVFYCQDAEAVQRSSKVNLTYSRGALGFYIIQSKQLAE